MDLLSAHEEAMRGFDDLVGRIGDRWAAPTPCTEWTVRDLLNHLVAEQLWVPHLLAGETLEEVGDTYDGDVLGADPVGAWRRSAAAARAAWVEDGATERDVHVSFGEIGAAEYGWQMTLDLAVHGWDLAKAIDVTSPIGETMARRLLEVFEPELEQWQGMGIFAPPVPVAADASTPAKLVALLGRDPG